MQSNKDPITVNKGAPKRAETGFVPANVLLADLGLSYSELIDNAKVEVNAIGVLRLLRMVAASFEFDEIFYLDRYPDVARSVRDGDMQSPSSHFVNNGFLEGRVPKMPAFDARSYYRRYEDLRGTFSLYDVEGLKRHYMNNGMAEGRFAGADT